MDAARVERIEFAVLHLRRGVTRAALRHIRDRTKALDCFVLALAALRILAPTPARFEGFAARLDVHQRTA